MRIAITGGNGFLGKKFISYSKKKNFNILKLPKANIENKNSFYKKKNKLKNFLQTKNINVFIHFAGVRKKECENRYSYAKKSIFDLTKNIIKEINSSKKNIKFIYISSDHVFDGNSKLYKENNTKNLKPATSLGSLKLRAENYVKNNLKNWHIIRLSAILDDLRLSKFVITSIKKKKELKLYTNIYFTPVLSIDLFNLIFSILNSAHKNNILHCSGLKRINKYDFYTNLLGKNFLLKKQKAKTNKFHPSDLSLSNKITSKVLNFKFTNFKRSIHITKKYTYKKK